MNAARAGWTPARAAWPLVVLLSLGVALFSLRYFAAPEHGALLGLRTGLARLVLLVHVAGGVLALAVGPFQFSGRLRRRAPRWHRRLGRAYVAGVLVGGVAGLPAAWFTEGGLSSHVAFTLLALLWLATTGLAVAAIRRRDVAAHRAWMVRGFALTFAAVTLRLWLPLLLVSGAPFLEAYRTVAWLCWVPNLIAAELWLAATRPAAAQPALGVR
jgi:uncharacterized membrane protein